MKAVILAGGLGTRLKGVITQIPKPMALIGEKPFLEYLLGKLDYSIIDEIILSVGYRYEVIESYFGDSFQNVPIKYSIENQPLGTGGGIRLALSKIQNNNEPVLILNGDTYFDFNLKELLLFHNSNNSDLTLSLKKMFDYDRYGSVIVDGDDKVIGFHEKSYFSDGLINCGVYLINKNKIDKINFADKFSFELDFMESYFKKLNFYAYTSKGYFIDIGIPADYKRAQLELK